MTTFADLQDQHDDLLKQLDSSPLKSDLVSKAQQYLKTLEQVSADIHPPEQRDQLNAILQFWAAFIFEHTKKYPTVTLRPFTGKDTRTWKVKTLIIAGIGLVIVAILIVMISLSTTLMPTFTLRYVFDVSNMGWVPQSDPENRAVVNVQLSPEQSKFGQSSLELQLDLKGGDTRKSKGETFVDLENNPPRGLTGPFSLEDKLITVWIYVPSVAIGASTAPNGAQVFVKDVNGNKQYGRWIDFTKANTEKWTTVTLTPSKDPTDPLILKLTDPNFDPSRIKFLGLKIGAGENSEAIYNGSIWIGGVSW